MTALALAAGGCTTFSNVRSAEVRAGPSVALQAAISSTLGPETGWFWSLDCASACSYPVFGTDMGFTHGWPAGVAGRPAELGLGVNGLYPYVDGYVQLGSGVRPFGVGARIGLPATSWFEHQLYGRYDVRIDERTRLLLNPALFVHHGRAPNGESPGSFVAFVQGVGLLIEGERVSFTPALAIVAGRAERTSYGVRYGPERSVFGTISLGVTFHRRASTSRQDQQNAQAVEWRQ
ncbi:MAG: hypothetical protein ACR2L6_03330 [Gemmatimonadaceae bacterium]